MTSGLKMAPQCSLTRHPRPNAVRSADRLSDGVGISAPYRPLRQTAITCLAMLVPVGQVLVRSMDRIKFNQQSRQFTLCIGAPCEC